MAAKNPHAVALGRKGGRVRSPQKVAAVRRNGRMGGQPRKYRLRDDGGFERRDGDLWLELHPPYDEAAQAALRRLRHRS